MDCRQEYLTLTANDTADAEHQAFFVCPIAQRVPLLSGRLQMQEPQALAGGYRGLGALSLFL
jgi:hypothetical protein